MTPTKEMPAEQTEALTVVSPMELLIQAAQKATPETLAGILEVQMRWEANEARKEYIAAMQQFKQNLPVLLKNKHVKAGQMEYDHATLDAATKVIGEALLQVGITHTWRTGSHEGKTRVTCVLTHRGGHSEDGATLDGPPDTSGSKNSVQAIGSTVTYLQRYTLLAATGVAAKNTDNDGQTSEGLPDQTFQDYLAAIEGAHNAVDLQQIFAEAWNKAKACKDTNSQESFRMAYDKRKRFFASQSKGVK